MVNTYLVENTYRSIRCALSVKKFLELPLDENGDPAAFPAVQFQLSRTYITSTGDASEPEVVDTLIWTHQEVEEAYRSQDDPKNTTLEKVLTFTGLDYYAPNGTRYTYSVQEISDGFLGGYDVYAVSGDAQIPADITQDTDVVENLQVTMNQENGHGETAQEVEVAAAFRNQPTQTPSYVTLTGEKFWNDFGNAFETRPDDLTLTLHRYAQPQPGQNNGIPLAEMPADSYTVTWDETTKAGENIWIYTITGAAPGLEEFAPNGMPWMYVVEESCPTHRGYAASVTEVGIQARDGGVLTMYRLTNSLATSVPLSKGWVDSEGDRITQDYLGVDLSVTFELQVSEAPGSDGVYHWQDAEQYFSESSKLTQEQYNQLFGTYAFTKTLTGRIDGTGTWSGSFPNLPRRIGDGDATVQLYYRAVETQVSYQVGGATVTQQYKTVDSSKGNTWTYETKGLFAPYYPNGVNYVLGTAPAYNQMQTTGLTVTKNWAGDGDNRYGTRPATSRTDYTWETSFLIQRSTDNAAWETVKMYKGEDHTEVPLILHVHGLDGDATASASISGLPETDLEGNRYTYRAWELAPGEDPLMWYDDATPPTVQEAEEARVEEGGTYNTAYTVGYDASHLTAANTFGKTLTFYGQKTWRGTSTPITLELQYLAQEDGKEVWKSFDNPATIRLDGQADDISAGAPACYEMAPDPVTGAWRAIWTGVPEAMPGSKLTDEGKTRYRIRETVPGGYLALEEKEQEVTEAAPTAEFVNVRSTSLTVQKVWGTRTPPDTIQVALYRVTQESLVGDIDPQYRVPDKTLALPAGGGWRGSFTGLPLYSEDGARYYYYAVETLVNGEPVEDSEYTAHYTTTHTDTAAATTIVNVGYTDIEGTKTWKDNSNAYVTRPGDITLTLWRHVEGENEKPVDVEPTWEKNGNTWTYTYKNLPESDDQGQIYTYRVEEILPQGSPYESASSGHNFTNTLAGSMDLPVTKVWNDNDNALEVRPEEVTVELYANGRATGETLALNEAGGWSGTFEGLAEYDGEGRRIQYTVVEGKVPDGYHVVYGPAAEGNGSSFTLTNVGEGSLAVRKTVTGSRGDRNKEFTFTVTLLDTAGEPLTEEYPIRIVRRDGGTEEFRIKSGETFTLRHGDEARITELPGNTAYRVEESDNAGYRVTRAGASGLIQPGAEVQASFNNYRGGGGGGKDPDPDPDPPEIPETGQNWLLPGLLALSGILALGLGIFPGRRKRNGTESKK